MSAGKINHRFPVVALHCSGASGAQWDGLRAVVGGDAPILTPDLIGLPSRGHWQGKGPFHFADEAEEIIAQMEALNAPAHIVAHSYGAATGLHIARKRPELVRSLCLYEPTLFSILRVSNRRDRGLFDEIAALVEKIEERQSASDLFHMCELFTDFWSGSGAWEALHAARQSELMAWTPKVLLDFHALMFEPEPESIVQRGHPITLMVGAETHAQTSRIGVLLAAQGENVELVMIPGAGHLEPFAKRPFVMEHILAHILRVEDC